MNRYYFISYNETRRGKTSTDIYILNGLIDIHPLQWQIDNRKNSNSYENYECDLISWNEISQEEYSIYKDIFDGDQ